MTCSSAVNHIYLQIAVVEKDGAGRRIAEAIGDERGDVGVEGVHPYASVSRWHPLQRQKGTQVFAILRWARSCTTTRGDMSLGIS